MYDIIPLALILISLSIILSIVVKKFSVLASLDVENIPAEKEIRVKERIVGSRIKKNVFKWSAKFFKVWQFIVEKLNFLAKEIFNKLIELKDRNKDEGVIAEEDKNELSKDLLIQAEELIKENNLEEAEKRLIKIIGLDSQNLDSWRLLANVYFSNKRNEEAEQTFKHILKLLENEGKEGDSSDIYFNLCLVNKEKENFSQALKFVKQALKMEPNNPRYLDIALEISIINKDKLTAIDVYQRLLEANPENQKLPDFQKQIDKI